MKRKIVLLLLLLFASALFGEIVPLQQIIDEEGLSMQWDPLLGRGRVFNEDRSFYFIESMPWILLGKEKRGAEWGRNENGGIVTNGETASLIRTYFSVIPEMDQRVSVILIDPGHGGADPGTIGYYTENGKENSVYEKDIVLDIASRLEQRLSGSFPEIEIAMTRDDDSYPSLEDRVLQANQLAENLSSQEAILFISIHVNYSINSLARGYEVWFLPQDYRRDVIDPGGFSDEESRLYPILNAMTEEAFSMESIELAQHILGGLDESVGNYTENRGTKEKAWYVVRNANMPSVLVEMGFISNEEEQVNLREDGYLQKLADGLYNGISEFIEYFEN